MPIDDFGYDGEAQPNSGLFGCDEGIEDGLELVGQDAATTIDYAHFGLSGVFTGAVFTSTNGDGSAGERRLGSVRDQIEEALFHQFRVDRDRGQGSVVAYHFGAGPLDGAIDYVLHIGQFPPGLER